MFWCFIINKFYYLYIVCIFYYIEYKINIYLINMLFGLCKEKE